MDVPHHDNSSLGVYSITTAAQLSGIAVSQLRAFEARGLLQPKRTDGGTRRYSDEDLQRARQIAALLAEGVNLAGVARILELEADNHRLRKSQVHQSRP